VNRYNQSEDYYHSADISAATRQSGHAWAVALSASLILIVCIRFLIEDLRVLPGLVQYIDVPITAVALFCSLMLLIRRGHIAGTSRLGGLLYLFVLVALASALVNSSRVRLLPSALFIFNFAAPLLFALITIDAPMGRRDIEYVLKTFFWLGVVEVGFGLFYGVPRLLVSGNPDYVSGTFGRNAYQFTYFVGIWFLYVLGGTLLPRQSKRRWENLTLVLAAVTVFGLFYAAQYRAMILFYTAVMLITLWLSPARPSKRFLQTIVVAAASVVTLIVVSTAMPGLKLLKVFDLFEDASPVVQSGKIQAVENLWTMYGDLPQTILVGSGPGTFTSRAFKVFSDKPKGETVAVLGQGLLGGQYSTDVADKYVRTINAKPIQGGITASTPLSSYTSLAAEVGLMGLAVYLGAYFMALAYSFRRLRASARAGDRIGTRLAFTCLGGLMLLLVQTLFDNWLETTRVAIPLWVLVGLLYAHKTDQLPSPHLTANDLGPGEIIDAKAWGRT
jgi:hypothetical protein